MLPALRLSKNFYRYPKWGLGRSPKAGRRDASPRIHPPPFRGKGGRGIGIINQKLISKTDFFYKLRAGSVTCPQIFCSFLYPMKLCGTTHQSIINKRQKN